MSAQNETNNLYKQGTQGAQIDEIFRSLGRIEVQLHDISAHYVKKGVIDKELVELEKRIREKIAPLEKIVYGLVAAVLSTVLVAILAIVIQGP